MIKTELDINSNDNSLFVTAQCNNRCLMCSQPPLNRDDIDLLFDRNLAIIESAPSELTDIGITGGEPTLLGDKLFLLIEKIKEKLPESQISHVYNPIGLRDNIHIMFHNNNRILVVYQPVKKFH